MKICTPSAVFSLPEKLPELDAYLRTRYRDELTATDRRSLERYFEELRSKRGRKDGQSGIRNYPRTRCGAGVMTT